MSYVVLAGELEGVQALASKYNAWRDKMHKFIVREYEPGWRADETEKANFATLLRNLERIDAQAVKVHAGDSKAVSRLLADMNNFQIASTPAESNFEFLSILEMAKVYGQIAREFAKGAGVDPGEAMKTSRYLSVAAVAVTGAVAVWLVSRLWR